MDTNEHSHTMNAYATIQIPYVAKLKLVEFLHKSISIFLPLPVNLPATVQEQDLLVRSRHVMLHWSDKHPYQHRLVTSTSLSTTSRPQDVSGGGATITGK